MGGWFPRDARVTNCIVIDVRSMRSGEKHMDAKRDTRSKRGFIIVKPFRDTVAEKHS